MSDSARDLLVRGIAAARANEKNEARFYLEWFLRRGEADSEQQVDALLWLSQVVDDPAKKRECLEEILALNPSHPLARRGMAILDGRLKPEDVVDHRKPIRPIRPISAPKPSDMRRYVCPKCGGKMAFDAKQRALNCGYCGHQVSEYHAVMDGTLVQEHDFFATLPTAQAHRWKLATARVVTCQGCGAMFALLPLQFSGSCPFCESAYVVETADARELIQPEGVLPFQFDTDAALHHVYRWLKRQRFRPDDLDKKAATARPRGVYLPFWTFDIGGEVKWHAVIEDNSSMFGLDGYAGRKNVIKRDDSYLVSHDDLLVPATHSLPIDILSNLVFDTHALVPYAPGLLADWATEIYQLSMADASLVARQRVFDAAKAHIRNYVLSDENVREWNCSSLGIVINTFKLVLLPVWMTSYQYEGKRYPLAVNGQTGKVVGNVPRSGFQKLLAWAFGDD